MESKLFTDDIEKIVSLLSVIRSSSPLSQHNVSVLRLVKNDLESAIENLQLLSETEENVLVVKKMKSDQMTYLRYLIIKQFLV